MCVCVFPPLVPPQKPKILNERGEMIQALAGPYDEGSDMVLLCEVRGGSPVPKIQWQWNGKPIDSTLLDFSFVGSQTSKLVIKNLSRMHQHSTITCRASNFPKTETTANVTIDLLRKSIFGATTFVITSTRINCIVCFCFMNWAFCVPFRFQLSF